MSQLHLQTHTQLGDHMVSYGLVKEYAKKYDNVLLYTKSDKTHLTNIRRLFSNITNVKVLMGKPLLNYTSIECGPQWYQDIKTSNFNEEMIFDRYWYKLAGVPFQKKFDNFKFNRDIEVEKSVFYDKLGLKDGEKFVFLHEDTARNFHIKRNLIPDMKIIYPTDRQDISALDFLYTIEQSTEVHVINSIFRTFIDLMNIKHDKLYYHRYTRDAPSEQPGCQLTNWIIYD